MDCGCNSGANYRERDGRDSRSLSAFDLARPPVEQAIDIHGSLARGGRILEARESVLLGSGPAVTRSGPAVPYLLHRGGPKLDDSRRLLLLPKQSPSCRKGESAVATVKAGVSASVEFIMYGLREPEGSCDSAMRALQTKLNREARSQVACSNDCTNSTCYRSKNALDLRGHVECKQSARFIRQVDFTDFVLDPPFEGLASREWEVTVTAKLVKDIKIRVTCMCLKGPPADPGFPDWRGAPSGSGGSD